MNWKKIGLFILFLIIGFFLFGLITVFGSFEFAYRSLFLPLFFLAFVVFLVLILKQYSRKKLIVIILLILVYWLIMAIPFPTCDSWGEWHGPSQTCTCIGIEKHVSGIFDAGWSQCVGIPTNYQCSLGNATTGERQQIPCSMYFTT